MYTLRATIDMFLGIVELLIIVRCFSSFLVRDSGGSPIIHMLYSVTEPIMKPARDLINKLNINTGMFDFSPILVFLAIRVVRGFL